MNPTSSRYWDNPPPPGTEPDEDTSRDSSKNSHRFDPYVKNPAYVGRESEYSSDRSRYRSRSRDRDRERRHRHDRRRRSRSRQRRRRYSSSRSRSRSPSYKRHSSRRYRRSRSRSHSHRSRRMSPERIVVKTSSSEKERVDLDNIDGDVIVEEDMKIEEEDDEVEEVAPIPFKNDGSFLEMFKKMQEVKKEETEPTEEVKKAPVLPVFGKRRGGKVLKTGMVQKQRTNEDEENASQDAWSIYMKEVRKYKEACCDDDSKTRPLVK